MGVSLRPDSSLHSPSETERAVFGSVTSKEIHAFLNDYARQQLGSGIARVRFRAGRIDAEDGNAFPTVPHQVEAQGIDEGALADAGHAGDADPHRLAGRRHRRLEEAPRRGAMIGALRFHERDGPRHVLGEA